MNPKFVYAPTFSNYLQLTGDTAPVVAIWYTKEAAVPFNPFVALTEIQLTDMKARFRMISRKTFNETMTPTVKNIASTIPVNAYITATELGDAIFSHLLEVFNQVNLDEMKVQGVTDPWKWEQTKFEAQYKAQAAAEWESSGMEAQISADSLLREQGLNRRAALEQRYIKLPPISDPAVQTQRSIAFKLLLDKEAFDTADMVIKFYETLSPEFKQVLNTQV